MSGIVIRGVLARRRSAPRPRRVAAPRSPHEPRRGDRAARQLALAHYVERLVQDGVVRDYAEVARALGMTRARLTQIVNLSLLAPSVQEAVLAGEVPASERRLRLALRAPAWCDQKGTLQNNQADHDPQEACSGPSAGLRGTVVAAAR